MDWIFPAPWAEQNRIKKYARRIPCGGRQTINKVYQNGLFNRS